MPWLMAGGTPTPRPQCPRIQQQARPWNRPKGLDRFLPVVPGMLQKSNPPNPRQERSGCRLIEYVSCLNFMLQHSAEQRNESRTPSESPSSPASRSRVAGQGALHIEKRCLQNVTTLVPWGGGCLVLKILPLKKLAAQLDRDEPGLLLVSLFFHAPQLLQPKPPAMHPQVASNTV